MTPDWIKSCSLLAGLDADEVGRLAQEGRGTSVLEGEVLMRMGDSNSTVRIIVSGAVKVTRMGAEGEVVLSTLKSGQTFGEMSFIDGSRSTATVTATETTHVLEIDRRVIDELSVSNPKAWGTIWKNIAVELRRRLLLSNDVVEQLTDANLILRDPALRDYYSLT